MKNLVWKSNNPFDNESSRNAGSLSIVSNNTSKTISAANVTIIAACNEAMNDNSNPQQGNKYTDSSTDSKEDKRKLFIGGLPNCVTDDVFYQYFEKFGKIVDSVVMYDKVTKRSRGFGFVTFEDRSSAQSVIQLAQKNDNKLILFGRRCEVKVAYPKPLYKSSENQQEVQQKNGRGKDRGVHKNNVNECIGSVWQQQCQMWPSDYRQAVSPSGSDCLNLNPYAPPSVNNYYGHFIQHNYPYINGSYLAHGYGQTDTSVSPLVTGPVFYAPYIDNVGMKNYFVPPMLFTGNGNYFTGGLAEYAVVPMTFPYDETSSLPDTPELTEYGHPATGTSDIPDIDVHKSYTMTPGLDSRSCDGQPGTKLTERMNTDD